jgi:hypothetical protein
VIGEFIPDECALLVATTNGVNKVAVVRDTVCISTNTVDKNGTLIFDGDVIEKDGERALVGYDENKDMIRAIYNGGKIIDVTSENMKESSVIYNIVDKPLKP